MKSCSLKGGYVTENDEFHDTQNARRIKHCNNHLKPSNNIKEIQQKDVFQIYGKSPG